ncbi:MAG: aspartate aminotransferase family protein [Ignavibacteriaceae bacterium]|nr:aspartate aminotransferase family protein [Ignavibacteriaceae bacterium]
MKNSINIFEREEEILLQTYKRIPIKISHGEGVYLYSKDGKKYLDFFSGLAVNALGYGNKKVIQAIEVQINKFIHLSNYYINTPQVELAEKLVKYSGLSKVFFANSGTEAVEASLKLIRKYFGPEKNIITFSNAFHGRTYGSLSLSGKEKYKKYFSPLLPNIIQLGFNDLEKLEKNVTENTAAIYLEFIQGEGGIKVASNMFVEKINELRNKFDFALVADEVQSGIGRTGKPFAYQHYNIEPDLVIVAKAIGGGLPLGALITNKRYDNVFQQGDHGSTFGGNPVACAAGLEVVNEVFENELVKNVADLGNYFKSELNLLHKKYFDKIVDVRGLGFMIGVELPKPCVSLVDKFREKGILVNCTNENVLRILPPLISTKENIDYFINIFSEILSEDK